MTQTPLSRLQFLVIVSLWLSIAANVTTLKNIVDASGTGLSLSRALFVVGGWLFVFTLILVVLHVFCLPFRGSTVRIPATIALLAGAALSFFTFSVGMQFDRTMLQNLLQTDVAEAADLVTWKLAAWMLCVGVLPCIFVWRKPLSPSAASVRAWVQPVLICTALFAATALIVYSQYARYSSKVRTHQISLNTMAPVNFVAAGVALWRQNREIHTVRAPIGLDAVKRPGSTKPRLVVFVVGETARAQNIGLNGYSRDTTPRMRELGGVYFRDTQSCGTTTAVSVPCMFSGMTREQYSYAKASSQETLIDVILRAGTSVFWRENDGGCKGVCTNAQVEEMNDTNDPKWCPEPGNCFDEVMLEGFDERIKNAKGDVLFVLHVKGSHGPAYFKRYPKEFERFTPACQSVDLSQCQAEHIRNAYDNTILYTDHVVGRAAAILKSFESRYATALFYVSDHGESLGENGMYLHGLPYAMAPETQTRVPMFAWLSPQFLSHAKWDQTCVNAAASAPRSHDHVFHTMLGLMDVSTHLYKKELDVFGACGPAKPDVNAPTPTTK